MPRFRTISALALTLGLVAGGSTAALAGDGPPTPAPSQQTVTPSPYFGYHPKPVRLRDWQFDVQQSDIGGTAPALRIDVNDVEGFGAIPMANWRDIQLSPNVDKFVRGPNSVTLWHDALPEPTVELDTCTINFDQNEGQFRILRGTGIAAGLRSVGGVFDLRGVISVRNVDVRKHPKYGYPSSGTVCPLQFLSTGQILRDVEYGRLLPGLVTFTDFAVQGDAKVFRAPVVKPYPVPTYTVTPTDTATA